MPTTRPYPALPGLAGASNGATLGLIPSKAWTYAFKMIPKKAGRYKPILVSLVCILGAAEAHFGATDLESAPVHYTRLLEGRFPDWRQAFPRPPATITLRANPLQLAELLRVASAFCPADDCKVTLEIYKPDLPIKVLARNGGQAFTGLIMPV